MYTKFITENYILYIQCAFIYIYRREVWSPIRFLAAGDLSLILCDFFFYIYTHTTIYRVIAWRHLLHRSKLSAINDSFSHIAFSISIIYELILYITYYTVYICMYIYIQTYIKTLNNGDPARHLLRIGEFYLWLQILVDVLIHTNCKKLHSQKRPLRSRGVVSYFVNNFLKKSMC